MADELETVGGLTRLFTAIEARLPGVLYPMVRAAIWDTVEDFLARSSYWMEDVTWDAGAIVENPDHSATITVPVPDGAALHHIVEVWGLGAVRIDQPDTIHVLGGGPRLGSASVVLVPATLDDTPDFVTTVWYQAIYEGACAKLYAEPDKPYSNKEAIQFYSDRFEKYVQQASIQAGRGGTLGGLSSDGVDRIYAAVRDTAGDEVSQSEMQRALWRAIEEFYQQSTWAREHVYWRMPTGATEVNFDPFDGYRRVAWVLAYTGLTQGRVVPPGALRDLTCGPVQIRCGEAWLALKPAGFAAVVRRHGVFPELWSTWFETILSGTLFRLLAAPKKPWTEPKLAGYHGTNFRRGIMTARAHASLDYHQGQPAPFPYFARGRGRAGGQWTSSGSVNG